jgi:hypothetical protein
MGVKLSLCGLIPTYTPARLMGAAAGGGQVGSVPLRVVQ